jgi:hypothetical protein
MIGVYFFSTSFGSVLLFLLYLPIIFIFFLLPAIIFCFVTIIISIIYIFEILKLYATGKIKINPKKLKKKIGSGSFGDVYKSQYFYLPIAIKKLKYNNLDSEKTLQELELSKGCNHPNVVSFIGYEIKGDFIYIVFDLIEGGNLKSFIKENDLTDLEKLYILRDIVKGMIYLHNVKNIVHRGFIYY